MPDVNPASAPAAAAPAAPAPAPAAPAAAAPAGAVDTAITGEGGQQTPNDGGGEADKSAGQGTGEEGKGPEGAASAEGDKPAEGEGEGAPGEPSYTAFTLPEGFELGGDTADQLTTFAKAHKLDQSQAQALVDMGVAQAQAIVKQYTDNALENPVPLAEHHGREWSKQTASDAELGGAKLAPTMALATRVFATFATPALGEFLNSTGLAHHPELIRFMAKVGAAVSEDTLVTPQGGTQRAKALGGDRDARAASKLYPGMN